MKKLILGLVIGLILGMSTNAFASITNGVEAVFANFNYTVNGSDAGTDVTVLVYDGTSYLRTTEVGNLLGYDVTYKADSRTIDFSKPDPTPFQPMSSGSPEPTTEPTPLPTDANGNVIPTPTPDPNATPAPSMEPTATPSTEPSPTPSASVTPTPSPTPVPSNTAQCQAIRDNYNLQIGHMQSTKPNGWDWSITQLRNQMAAALSAAGCN
jgi:hypothetical protein